MKRFLLLLVGIILTSCAPDPIEETVKQEPPVHVNRSNMFTVVWYSNQEGPKATFSKHVFKDCKVQSTITEVHSEHKFNIVLEDNQFFDIYINNTASVKNPEVYIAIYKGDVLQYEQEVNTNSFAMSNYVDRDGNIGQ